MREDNISPAVRKSCSTKRLNFGKMSKGDNDKLNAEFAQITAVQLAWSTWILGGFKTLEILRNQGYDEEFLRILEVSWGLRIMWNLCSLGNLESLVTWRTVRCPRGSWRIWGRGVQEAREVRIVYRVLLGVLAVLISVVTDMIFEHPTWGIFGAGDSLCSSQSKRTAVSYHWWSLVMKGRKLLDQKP